MKSVPLFPLNTVLFPEGVLPLRIFEPRYTDMISECLKSDSGFGVCLIDEGNEVGQAATIHKVGTLARIIDFQREEDGLLGITTIGTERILVLDQAIDDNQLLRGDVRLLDEIDDVVMPVEFELLADMLRQILEKFEIEYADQHERLRDTYWVGSRLAELLPLELTNRQHILEIDDPVERLHYLQKIIARMDIRG